MSTIKLKGSSSGEAEVTVAAAAGTPTFTLPTTVGSANQLVKNSGTAGTLQYTSVVEDSNGKVGIGETSPSTLLHLKSGSNTAATFQTSNNGSSVSTNYTTPNRTFYTGVDIGGVNSAYTIYDGTAGAERLRVESGGNVKINDGNLLIGGTGHGIDFSGSQTNLAGMETELLDSYEEGTYTPVVSYASTNDHTYSEQAGHYTKIGNFVHGTINLTWNEQNSTGGVGFSLPFTSANASSNRTSGYFLYQDGMDIPDGGSPHLILYGGNNSSVIYAYFVGGNDNSEMGPGSTYLSNSHTSSNNTARIVFHYLAS